jgi:hypothetical protein
VLGDDLGVGDAPDVALFHEPLELFVSPKRISAGRDVIEDARQTLGIEGTIGERGLQLGEQSRFLEWRGAGAGEHMLREDIEPAGAENLVVELAVLDRVEGGARFEIFETIARHDDGFGWLVEPMVRPADPLEQP